MPDNFLHAQYADILRRHGFVIDVADKRWTNPETPHIVVSFSDDEYVMHQYEDLPRLFSLRDSPRFENLLQGALRVNSARDAFRLTVAWLEAACTELNERFSHTRFFVRVSDKASPDLWFEYNDIDHVPMLVAHSAYLLQKMKSIPLDVSKSDMVLQYMAASGFYESLDTVPAVDYSDTKVTYYIQRNRLQNCALISLEDVVHIEEIEFTTQTRVVDIADNVPDSAINALINERQKHEYVAFTCQSARA